MKIAFCASEVFPYAKTGGLGDVAGALPHALAREGAQVKIFMPLYKGIKPQTMKEDFGINKDGNLEVIFIKNDNYFCRDSLYVGDNGHDYPDSLERYSFYSKKVFDICKELDFAPDIFHTNDWQTSLVNVYLKTLYANDNFFKNSRSVLTIHNLAYQGLSDKSKFPLLGVDERYFDVKYLEFYDKVNLLKGGIVFSDMTTTVSPTYAKQIQTPEYGCGLEGVFSEKSDHLRGVLNAIDYDIWNPQKDDLIYKKYSPQNLEDKALNKEGLQKEAGLELNSDKLLLGMVSRLAEQKGIDILSKAIDAILDKHQLIILGLGEPRYQEILKQKQAQYGKSFHLALKFDEALAHKIYAGCDVFLLPSRFEPCGLSQMISYKYGTIPLVNHTGGLVDTVVDVSSGGGGFAFDDYSHQALIKTINRAKKAFKDKKRWRDIQNKITGFNFSWDIAAGHYIQMYKELIRE